MNTQRRSLLVTTALAVPLLVLAGTSLTGCAATGMLTDAQVVAVLTGAVTTAKNDLALIITNAPTLISVTAQNAVTTGLATAATLLTNLGQTLAPQGASIVAQINGYINAFLNTAATVTPAIVGALPTLAPVALFVQAIDAVAPEIETFVDQYLPAAWTTPTVSARLAEAPRLSMVAKATLAKVAPAAPPMSIPAAYNVLGVKPVK